jgi:hypothetical protein
MSEDDEQYIVVSVQETWRELFAYVLMRRKLLLHTLRRKGKTIRAAETDRYGARNAGWTLSEAAPASLRGARRLVACRCHAGRLHPSAAAQNAITASQF